MRKKLSKVIALLFILATTLGGEVSVFAAPGAKPDEGNLHIHKYWVDDQNPHPTGKENNGTEQDDITNPPVSGVGFDVYKIGELESINSTPATPEEKEKYAVPQGGDGWVYKKNADKLEVTNGTLTYIYALGANVNSTSEVTNSTGTLTFSNLEKGYYFVEENLSYGTPQVNGKEVKITSQVRPFVVAVPMTTPNGEDWMKDVHVYPKNEGLNPEKKPSVPSVNVGDTVGWTITVNIPTDIASYTKFDIIDILDKRLNYAGNLVVNGLDNTGSTVATLDNNTHYELTAPNAGTDGGTVTVKLLVPEGIKFLANNKNIVKLSVSFDTTVNGNIENDDENKIKNEATIDFENESGTDSDKVTAEINTGEIKIDKTYSGGTVEESAEFQLAKTDTAAKAGEYLRVVLDSTNTHIVDIVAPGESGYEDAKKWIALPSETDASKFGLKDGEKSGDTFYVKSFEGLMTYSGTDENKQFESYYLVETKAPEGYNLLDGPLEVTFTEEDNNNKHVHLEKIENKKGFTLPNTGGIGTILLVVVGIILIGLAIILTMNKKKKTA